MRHSLRIIWELWPHFIDSRSPLPFTAMRRDLRGVLDAVRRNRRAPALFAINAY